MNKEKIVNFYKKINSFLKENVIVLIFIFLFFIKYTNSGVDPLNFTRRSAKNNAALDYSFAQASEHKEVPMKTSAYDTGSKIVANINSNVKKIIKNVGLTIKVEDTEKSRKNLEKSIEDFGGFVDNFYSYDYYDKQAINFSINIPTINLDKFLLKVKGYGEVKSENFSVQDKTEMYSDNENKLQNLYSRRNSLRKMLETRATILQDILAIDKELNNVQYEIERFEKMNQSIDNKVEFSNINLTVLPNVVIENKVEKWKLKTSLNKAINVLIKVIQKMSDYLLVFLVFSPILLVIFLVYKLSFRKK